MTFSVIQLHACVDYYVDVADEDEDEDDNDDDDSSGWR